MRLAEGEGLRDALSCPGDKQAAPGSPPSRALLGLFVRGVRAPVGGVCTWVPWLRPARGRRGPAWAHPSGSRQPGLCCGETRAAACRVSPAPTVLGRRCVSVDKPQPRGWRRREGRLSPSPGAARPAAPSLQTPVPRGGPGGGEPRYSRYHGLTATRQEAAYAPPVVSALRTDPGQLTSPTVVPDTFVCLSGALVTHDVPPHRSPLCPRRRQVPGASWRFRRPRQLCPRPVHSSLLVICHQGER